MSIIEAHFPGTGNSRGREVGAHLEVRHVFVALLRARVVRQLYIPEAGQLVDQEGVLLDHRIEDVLHTHKHMIGQCKY